MGFATWSRSSSVPPPSLVHMGSGATDPWVCHATPLEFYVSSLFHMSSGIAVPATQHGSKLQLVAVASCRGAVRALQCWTTRSFIDYSSSERAAPLKFVSSNSVCLQYEFTRVWFNGFNILCLRRGATTTLRKPRSYGSTPTESSLGRNSIQKYYTRKMSTD